MRCEVLQLSSFSEHPCLSWGNLSRAMLHSTIAFTLVEGNLEKLDTDDSRKEIVGSNSFFLGEEPYR